MRSIDWGCSTRMLFGKDAEKDVGERIKKYARKALIVYGGGSIKKIGLYDSIVASLKKSGVDFMELSGVKANPTLEKIYEGIRLCRENDIGFILAVGGGSPIDTAKAIALGVPYEGDVWDFFGKRVEGMVPEKALPLAAVLTIPGTGSECSPNAVVTNDTTKDKIGINSDLLRPVFSVMNPEWCTSIPKSQVSNGVYDAMSHTMDRYFTNSLHTEVIDGISESIIRVLMKNGLLAYKDQSDIDAWAELLIASDLAHCGVTGIGRERDWACHKIEEAVSGLYDIPHGAGLSIITPAWMKYVYRKHIPMFVQFAVNVMGIKGSYREQERLALEGIEALEEFSKKMGLPTRFCEVGITDKDFVWMAKRCAELQGGRVGALEKLTWEDIVEIYKIAM